MTDLLHLPGHGRPQREGGDNSKPPALTARHSVLLAIDSPTTRDVDDAIAIAQADGGGWNVTVMIANPAVFVPIGSAEDAFARSQAATVYQQQHTIQSMLPRPIAEHRAALKAGVQRPALSIELHLSGSFDATVRELSMKDAAVIDAHVPYTTVAARARDEADPLHDTLRELIGVSQALLASRRRHGALAYFDLGRLLFLDEEGRMKRAKNPDDAIGQVLVQEFMILANAAVASWAIERDVPILFRNHHAKNAAPPAPDVANTIQGWLSGSALNETAAREQLNMILGVADYGASVEGHYALNLPAYTHATSPIRRYPDLVNLRQLHAALLGSSLPYSKGDLAVIAGEVSATLANRKQERKEGFKETIVRRATLALGNQRFETLADHELGQVLKLATAENEYPDALVSTVVDRIQQGTLSDAVFDRMLGFPSGSLPHRIAEAWAAVLAQAPQRARHLLHFGMQTGLLADYKSNPVQQGRDVGSFVDHAAITRLADGTVLTATGTSTRKHEAANIAAARLVLAHLGVKPPLATRPGAPDPGAATSGANFKGRLQERCQKHRWASPRYDTRMEGPTNATVFHSTVTIVVGQQEFTASSAGAKSRISAEHAAAEALLVTLPVGQPSRPPGSNAADNPIGTLQERCQQAGLPLPVYTVHLQEDGGFSCTVTTVLLQGEKFTASAASKAEAKRGAARLAVDRATTTTTPA